MKDDEVSSTALTVLQGILYTGRKKEYAHLVSDEVKDACINILESSEAGKKRLKLLDSKLFTMSVPLIEKLMIPGLTLHYALRKKYIEEFVENAIERGFTQVVNLGAGFDTLAYRLSQKYANVNFIEIDHPATQRVKRESLMKIQIDNLHLLSVDFAKQNLKDSLSEFEAFDSKKDTIFISEGVLMYLSEKDVRDLFHSLKSLTSEQMEFIFTYLEPKSENKDSYGMLLNLYLRFKNEHLSWDIKQNDLDIFLKSLNYETLKMANADDFKKTYLPKTSATLHRGENIAIAK